ncbi:MAG TPA: glycosyltransferase [Microlunatus sp.]
MEHRPAVGIVGGMLHTTSILFTSHRFAGGLESRRDPRRPQRWLFCGLPAYGHLWPLLPLAAAARTAGHEVVFATGSTYVPVLEAQGFPARAAGAGPLEVAREIFAGPVPRMADGGPNRAAQAELFLDALPRRNAPELLSVLSAWAPDLVIYEQTAVGAALAAAVTGIPAVAHGIVAGDAVETFDPDRSPTVPELLADFGLRSTEDLRPARFLDPFPSRLRTGPGLPVASTAIRPVPWRDPHGATPRWLTDSPRPVVYLTLGTIFGTGATMRLVIDALAGSDVDVLLALGPIDPADLGPTPENIHLEAFVDQGRILPLVDLVLHHGGSGTTLGAAAYGLPQLILPVGADQQANGRAVSAAGVGGMITPDQLRSDRVGDAVAALLADPHYAAAADQVRRQIAAMPSANLVVEGLTSSTPVAA